LLGAVVLLELPVLPLGDSVPLHPEMNAVAAIPSKKAIKIAKKFFVLFILFLFSPWFLFCDRSTDQMIHPD
jgi:hypothetical protein